MLYSSFIILESEFCFHNNFEESLLTDLLNKAMQLYLTAWSNSLHLPSAANEA